MIPADEYHNARQWLADRRRPLLLSHRRPDGDALGALSALAQSLRGWGLDPLPVLFDAFPKRYNMLAAPVEWRQWESEQANLLAACDALVICDTCSFAQLEPAAAWIRGSAPPTLVIDHHPTRDEIGTRPGDLRLIDEHAAAVCVIIAEWLKATGVALAPALATPLLVGIATDTGWFRHSNADARTLGLAAELTEAGASPNAIWRAIYEQDAPARLRLIGRMLDSLELHAGDRLAVLRLREADFAAAGADRSMTEDIINEVSRLGCTEATILFTEEPDASVRVNFRSKATLDVAALAQRFEGGGHRRAAGARPGGSWDDVVPQVIAAAVAELDGE